MHWRNASIPMRPSGPQDGVDPPIVTTIVDAVPPRSNLTLGAFLVVCTSPPTPCVRPVSDARPVSAAAMREPATARVPVAPVSTNSVPAMPSAVTEAAYCRFSNGDSAFRHTREPLEINGRLRPSLATASSNGSNRRVGTRRSSTDAECPGASSCGERSPPILCSAKMGGKSTTIALRRVRSRPPSNRIISLATTRTDFSTPVDPVAVAVVCRASRCAALTNHEASVLTEAPVSTMNQTGCPRTVARSKGLGNPRAIRVG